MAYIGSGSIKIDAHGFEILHGNVNAAGGADTADLYLSGAHSFAAQKIHLTGTTTTNVTIKSSYVEIFAGRAVGDTSASPALHTIGIGSPQSAGQIVHFRCLEAPSGSSPAPGFVMISGNFCVDNHSVAIPNATLGTGQKAVASAFTLIGTGLSGGKWAVLSINDETVMITS